MDFGRRFWRFFWARGLLGGVLIGVFFLRFFSQGGLLRGLWVLSEGWERHTCLEPIEYQAPGTRLGRDIGLGPAEDLQRICRASAGPLLGRDRNESKLVKSTVRAS